MYGKIFNIYYLSFVSEFQIMEGLSALLHWCDEGGKKATQPEEW